MSLPRLDIRVARLEAQGTHAAPSSQPIIVWMVDGDTRATALQAAGVNPADVADRYIIYVQYEGPRHACTP